MNVCLPDMSGPPTWWDALVLSVALVGAVSVVRRRARRRWPNLSDPALWRLPDGVQPWQER